MAGRKLHEVLGSQSQVFGQATKCLGDLSTTFEKKRHLFAETVKTYKADGEESQPVTEAQSTLQSTVRRELTWIADILAKAYDSEATIDEGNTRARANVVLSNGTILLQGLPATQLMQLDKRLGELQQFVAGIPVLRFVAPGLEIFAATANIESTRGRSVAIRSGLFSCTQLI